MWVADVDVVCGCGHVVGGCVIVVVMCIVFCMVCIVCRSYASCVGGMHCPWAASSLGGGQTVVCGQLYMIASSPSTSLLWK